MKFSNLESGGLALLPQLAHFRAAPQTLVLGLVRGGAPAAAVVAAALQLPLDWILMRAVFMDSAGHPERAVMVAGARFVDEGVLRPGRPLVEQAFVAEALDSLDARDRLVRGERVALSLRGFEVLLVDCGMRTGGTMVSAIRACRALGAARVVVAVPVASKESCERLRPIADAFICLSTPEPFGNVGLWYRPFDVPLDTTVSEMVRSSSLCEKH